jgi:DNA transformation protein
MANTEKDYVYYVVDKLSGLGDVHSRNLFGGYGIFHEGLCFAIVADDILYFKVDDSNRDMYEKAGSTRFPHPISYWQVPDEVFEDTAKLWEWANISIAIAQAKAKPKKKRKL